MEDDTEGDGMGSAMGVVDDPEFCSKYQHKNRRDVSRLFRSIPSRENEPPSHNIQQSNSMNNCLPGLNSGIIDPHGWLHKNSDDDIIPQESSDDETFVKEPFEPASTTEDSDMLSRRMKTMDLEPTQINTQSMADNPSPLDLFPYVDVVNGPTTFIKEYNGWPTSESLCSSMTRKSNESDEDEENSSLVMSEGYNIPISVSVDNPAASRLYERTLREIDVAEEEFVVPGTIWSRVEDAIENGYNPIILTGTSELLQKRICLKFLNKFASEENNIASLTSTQELFTCLQDNKPNKVLVLENAFGKDSFNPTTFKELVPILSKYKYENIKAMMLTSKVHCFNPCKIRVKDSVPQRDYFQYQLINLDMTENMLSSYEKMVLLDKSLDIVKNKKSCRTVNLSEEQKKVICNTDNPIFLECCKCFETYTFYDLDLVAFFREPMPCLVTQFERLKEECKKSYAALFLCAIEGRFYKKSDLTTVQKEYLAETGIKIFEKIELSQKCKLFCDSFLEEDMKQETVRYRHEMYRNAILCTLWKTDSKFLIENCPITFLTNILPMVIINNFFPKVISFDKENDTNVLQLLAQRFIKEITNGNCALLASNKLWEKDIFRNHVERLCKKSKVFEAVIQAHELGTSFLAWSAWNNSSELVKWILSQMKINKFKITDICKRRIEDAILISCVSGNKKACKYLYEGIWHKVQSIEEHCGRSAVSFHYVNTDPLRPNYQVVNKNKKHRYDTVWHTAAAYGHLDILEYFCSKKVNIDLQDSHGCTSLHIACRLQETETVGFLLNKRANVDVVDARGDTAIHEACGLGNIEITKLLLTHKPKLLVNNNCQTVYQKAVSSMNLELLKLLIEEIEIHVDNQSNDRNPPHLIHKDNSQHSIKQRLESLKDIQGETLLHKACLKDNNDKILRYLVEKSPNLVQQENLKDTTALHRACESLEETVMTEYLIEHGADVNAQNCDLDTPLHFACRGSKVKQIELLFSKDARYVSNSNNIYPHNLTANAEVKDCCKRLIPRYQGIDLD